jgi:alkylated DNA repair dioxygenase AlkB
MAGPCAIADGGWLIFEPHLFEGEEADQLLERLRTVIEWRQEQISGRPVPRLNAFVAEAGVVYAYSGITHRGEGWPEWLRPVLERVEAASGATFNSILLNFYRSGQDSMGMHTDAEAELGENPVVATLSFGAEREFLLKHRWTQEALRYRLGHGSLLVMGGTSQHHWLHGLPKVEAAVGERISLTFRRILGAAASSPQAPAGIERHAGKMPALPGLTSALVPGRRGPRRAPRGRPASLRGAFPAPADPA